MRKLHNLVFALFESHFPQSPPSIYIGGRSREGDSLIWLSGDQRVMGCLAIASIVVSVLVGINAYM